MRSMDPDYFKRLEQFIDDYMDEYGRSPTTVRAGRKHRHESMSDSHLDFTPNRMLCI